MAQQHINYSTPNDGLGDTLRDSQVKSESNFNELYANKVDKVSGKALSDVNFSAVDKAKLDSLDPNAGTQADWNQGDILEPDYINNKPENLSDFFNDLPQFLNAVGSFNYSDEATQTVPISVTSGVEAKLTNDTLGAYTDVSQAPYGVTSVYNTITNQFDFSQLTVGDWVEFRDDLLINLVGTNTSYKLYIKMAIGSGAEWTLNIYNGERKSTDEFNEVHYSGFVIGNEDTRDFPAELWILTDANASIKVNGWLFNITRKNINVVDITGTIDPTIIEDSPNAVAGGAVFDEFLNYVKLTGNQSIAGNKTIEDALILEQGADFQFENSTFKTSFNSNTLTADRGINLPDKDGVVALISDIVPEGSAFSKFISTLESESFGDSITVGQGATVGFSYIELFTSYFDLTNINRAVSARGIWESARLHNSNINIDSEKASIIMAGFNDVRRGGNAAKTISKIKNGYRAIIVNQFLNTFVPAKNTGGSIATNGTWSDYFGDVVGGKSNATSGYGGYNSTIGSYKEYTFTGTNVVLAMIGTDGVIETHGNFDVTIDGVLQGNYTGNNKTDGISDGSNANNKAPYILYFGGLTDATHTIRVTVTSANFVAIDYFGNLKDPRFCTPLFMVDAPKMNSTGYAISPALATDAIINELNTELSNVIAEFSSDYPIYQAITNDYYDVTTGLSVDNIHPNDVGYRQIYSSILNASKDLIINKPEILDAIETTSSFALKASDTGRIFIIKNSSNVTISNGLPQSFQSTFVTLAGVTLTIIEDTSVLLFNADNLVIPEKSSFSIKNMSVADNYVYYGDKIPVTPPPTYGVPVDALVSYYKFDETSGTTLDDSYGNDPFTSVTALNLNQTGKQGVCVSWSATNSKANTITASLITGNFSINLWLYREQTTVSANTGLIDIGVFNANTGFGIWINASNQLQWRIGNSYNNAQAAATIPATTWTMVTMVYNGTTVKFYLDGTEVSSSSWIYDPTGSAIRQIFRRSDDGEVGFKGKMDELSIYAKALTTTEIGLHYNSGAGATL